MKFLAALVVLVAASAVNAHSSLSFPLPRGHPLNPNAAKVDRECITAPLNGDLKNPNCDFKKNNFPCGGYEPDTKVTQVLKAGQVINVTFSNPNINSKNLKEKTSDQARHNGGICEFALSYDGGKSFKKIGGYSASCPDVFFEWPVLIPEDAPSCDERGQCIFSWSWINAVGNREFYQNCADVKIVGTAKEPLRRPDITKANLPGVFDKILQPPGDKVVTPEQGGNAAGTGPSLNDIKANVGGAFGPGGPSNPSKKPSPAKPKPIKSEEPVTPEEPSPNDPDTPAKKPSPNDPAPPTEKPSPKDPSPPGGATGGACAAEGSMTCTKGSTTYLECIAGKFMERPVPSGTVCQPDGDSVSFVNRRKRRSVGYVHRRNMAY